MCGCLFVGSGKIDAVLVTTRSLVIVIQHLAEFVSRITKIGWIGIVHANPIEIGVWERLPVVYLNV